MGKAWNTIEIRTGRGQIGRWTMIKNKKEDREDDETIRKII